MDLHDDRPKPMTTNNTNSEQPGDATEWQECETGAISGMVRHLKGRRRKTFALQLTCAVSVGIFAGLLFVHFRNSASADPTFADISCQKVREHAERYIAGDLSDDLKRQIGAHLDECPHCPDIIRDMKRKAKSGADGSGSGSSGPTATVSQVRSRRTPVG
ncbi:MAG: zf-HC2 domain-containing protein, partial [Planctomycetes bacterium]|nr:zf-HC2 domain-containing protein [Planctomycetota bacterium]